MRILPAHFVPAPSRAAARELFAASVRLVEIETFTYCNRTCWFCPNSRIDRRTTNRYMDEELYLRILSELAEVDYRGTISYSRYNEPLADRVILTRLRQARQVLPNAILSTHTNGDYLTRDYLDELRSAGLNRIVVMTYGGNDDAFSDRDILTRMVAKVQELGLRCRFTKVTPGVRYSAVLEYDGMQVLMDARDFAITGTDRGKLIPLMPYTRTSWCPIVFTDVYIDWDGRVVPCCNIRSDAPEHEAYVVDALSASRSVFEAYASSQLVQWRRTLANFEPKHRPCDSCRFAVMDDDPGTRAMLMLAQGAV